MRPPINPTMRSPLTDPTHPLQTGSAKCRYKDESGAFRYTTEDLANDPRWTLIEPLFDPPYYIQIGE